jgi:formylglycine-generating enzyme required for sulfatase activity
LTTFQLASVAKQGTTLMKTKLGLLLLMSLIAVGCQPENQGENEYSQSATDAPVGQPVESITNTIGMSLKLIPAGTFLMGSPEGEEGRRDDEHQHKVRISKPFYMQTTEVTQGQWKAVMGTEPWKGKSDVKEGPDYPAVYVSWNDAVAYCKKLSEKEGQTYRLPTEAEWENACRAGTKTAWSFGNDEKVLGDYAWYDKNALDIRERYAHQVRLKKPNAFGLYDMHGNAHEWCHDFYGKDYYKQSPEQDPAGPLSGSLRVLRGGSWGNLTRRTRSAFRFWVDPDRFSRSGGFRLVRELDPNNVAAEKSAVVVRAAAEKAAAERSAAEKAAAEKAAAEKAAAEKAAAEKAAAEKAAAVILARDSITNTIEMTFNKIPAGTFLMGSPETAKDRNDDEHQHMVTISKAFYMQTTEVTQGQWRAVMGTEPWKGKSDVKDGPNYPASCVSWNDAVAYCKNLSEAEGKTYRLPTEAEWEYACRAGTQTRWSFGNDEKVLGDYAWYDKNTWGIDEKYAHQVGLKKPNAFGLYDMHGNVWEWCDDYYGEDYYKQSPAQDPTGPVTGSSRVVRVVRVLRGGSWGHDSRRTRSAGRGRFVADNRNFSNGFRLVRELD